MATKITKRKGGKKSGHFLRSHLGKREPEQHHQVRQHLQRLHGQVAVLGKTEVAAQTETITEKGKSALCCMDEYQHEDEHGHN